MTGTLCLNLNTSLNAFAMLNLRLNAVFDIDNRDFKYLPYVNVHMSKVIEKRS